MTAYLAEAEELRLFTRIESNFECLRREGRVAGVLSGWGDALQGKYRRDAAEKGHLNVLKWLIDNGCPSNVSLGGK